MKRINLLRSLRKRAAGNAQGFTLLEILVVLTIMGFLIAMVAPRLATVGGDAVDTVCDTNQNRMITYLATFLQQKNRLPSGLTNLITEESSTEFHAPEVSDGDPEDGDKGVLCEEFGLRNNLSAHTLNASEAGELQGLGIDKVYNLNDPEDARTDAPFMEEVDIAEGLVVSMVGMGAADTSSDLALTAHNNVEGDETASILEYGLGEPDKLGRIVFGLGPECELITGGIISNAAHCPGGMQNDDNCSYNDYNIVVPRLAATVDRLPASGIFNGSATTTAIAYMDGELTFTTGTYDITGNDDHHMKRTVRLDEQEIWEYTTQCPEGHVYPESHDHWAIDLNNDGNISE